MDSKYHYQTTRNGIFIITAFIVAFLSAIISCAQTMKSESDESLDFSAIEAYFMLADQLKQNIEPSNGQWKKFFEAPINAMMISAGALDTNQFKNNLRKTYLTADDGLWEHQDNKELRHHFKYRDFEDDLKKHIVFLKSSNVMDSISKYLLPFLPERLCVKNNIPKQYYIFYGSEDATGGGEMVINDLYLSYKIDKYRLGLLSAHEAFHSIVSKAFGDLIEEAPDVNKLNIGLLYFLSNISQEGVADLIDKPLLMNLQSPLKKEMNDLIEDEVLLTTRYINKLDSLLRNTEGNLSQDFNNLFNNYSKNGGHIPGRLMGKVIKDCGLLPDLLHGIEDPILFLELYNEAIKSRRINLPNFSKESLSYLNALKLQYYKKP